MRLPTTGTPAAIASAGATPKVSAEREGASAIAAPARSPASRSSSTAPSSLTSAPRASPSRRERSGPSPAITSAIPARRQAPIATSIPFSAARRETTSA